MTWISSHRREIRFKMKYDTYHKQIVTHRCLKLTVTPICSFFPKAPTGRKIKLAFSTFNVGVSGCAGDFLGIDTSGDPLYKTAAKKYCAITSPFTVTSSGVKMNVLLKGIKGGYPGFTATFSVVWLEREESRLHCYQQCIRRLFSNSTPTTSELMLGLVSVMVLCV